MERIDQKDIPASLFTAVMQVQNYVHHCGLDPVLLELIFTRVSLLNGCAYCLDMHTKDATAKGESWQRLITLSAWREAPYYSDKERAALAFAERLTLLSEQGETEDLHQDVATHFTKTEIVNLTMAIAQINTWNRLVRSFGTVPGSYQPAQTAGTEVPSSN